MSSRLQRIANGGLVAVVGAGLLVYALGAPSPDERAAQERWQAFRQRWQSEGKAVGAPPRFVPAPGTTAAPEGTAASSFVPVPPEHYLEAFYEAIWARHSRCGGHSRHLDVALAYLSPLDDARGWTAAHRDGLINAIQRHELDYDPVETGKVLAAFVTAPCDGKAPSLSSVFHGHRRAGETCSFWRSCEETLRCEEKEIWNHFREPVPAKIPGVCIERQPDREVGQGCGGGFWCHGGLCDQSSWTCVAAPAEGQPCVNGTSCGTDLNLRCEDGTCRRPRKLGETCSGDRFRAPFCGEGDCWPDGICRAMADLGEPCLTPGHGPEGRLRNRTCRGGLRCVPATAGATAEAVAGKCDLAGEEGEACSHDDDCQAGHCGRPGFPNVCVDPTWHPWVPTTLRRAIVRVDDALVRVLAHAPWAPSRVHAPPAPRRPIVAGAAPVLPQVSAGASHTCERRLDGTVWCWGSNDRGQLGDGTTASHGTPVAVVGIGAGVAQVSAGADHTCAVKVDGTVWCWGSNAWGQLGDGTWARYATPTQVTGLDGATRVSAGGGHTCAVKSDGTLWCWGRNDTGQLGDGSHANHNAPVRVGLRASVADVSAGTLHTCARTEGKAEKTDATVWCWGSNGAGQLGDGSNIDQAWPTRVNGLGGPATEVSAGGDHTCAVRTDGTLWCWGGERVAPDPGPTDDARPPAMVAALGAAVAHVSVARTPSTCAVKTDGSLWCWSRPFSDVPEAFGAAGGPVSSVSLGGRHTCAVRPDGAVSCWGANDSGQLGDVATGPRPLSHRAPGAASGPAATRPEDRREGPVR